MAGDGGFDCPKEPLVNAGQRDSAAHEHDAASSDSGNVPRWDLARDEFARQWSRVKRRVVLFIEPSPFAYVCGYMTRFQNYIRSLRDMNDEVLVVTTHKGAPAEFYGAKVIPSWSFPCPWYQSVPLSLALTPNIIRQIKDFKPDIIHSTSPGIMCFGALATARLLSVPLVFSYHTHVPAYVPKYTFSFLVEPMWSVIRFLHRSADHTLTTSHALARELLTHGAGSSGKMGVWPKGVDAAAFSPKHKSDAMRKLLSDGETKKPLIVHVGRLGAEKNLELLKPILKRLPGVRLALVGDGPMRAELEKGLSGLPVVFAGQMQGEKLSQAYASGDIFITPSESETLGNVVLEAMASGVPVVAARAGGIPDIVQENKTGLLFDPGNVDDAVSKLRQLLDSKKEKERLSKAARSETEKLDWKACSAAVRNEEYSAAVQAFLEKKHKAQGVALLAASSK